MSQTESLNIDFTGIVSLLTDNKLKVPLYQRGYAWTKKEVEDLLGDIQDNVQGKSPDYFLGTVVIIKRQQGRHDIIDGQQRLVTVSLILCAIRDYMVSVGDSDRAAQIESEYISKTDLRSRVLEPKLILNSSDHNYYHETILKSPAEKKETSPQTDSQKRIFEAFQIISDKVFEIGKKGGVTALLDWIDFLKDLSKVIVVKAANDANAYTIFETLNDRGLDLAVTDLLKNYLYSLSDDQLDIVRDSWVNITSILDPYGGDGLLIDFFRAYWSSKYGLTRERALYSEIKKQVKTKAEAVAFASEVRIAAAQFEGILNPDSPQWSEHSDKVRRSIRALNIFNIKVYRPLLLSVVRNFDKANVEQVITKIASWAVRGVIGGVAPSPIESIVCSLAKRIESKEIKSATEVVKEFRASNVLPSDESFRSTFQRFTVSKQEVARFILRELEVGSRGGVEAELVPNSDASDVNLEHIVPKKLNGDWNLDAKEHAAVVKRLGNMTLMKATKNAQVGNSAFSLKKEVFKTSEYVITKDLGQFSSFGVLEINQRQEKMAEVALKIWGL
jgi:hypothetical protein